MTPESQARLLEGGYALHDMEETAAVNAWPLEAVFPADEGSSVNEWVYRLDRDHHLHYLESTRVPVSYLLVSGPEADGWLAHLEPAFPLLTLDDLLAACDRAVADRDVEVSIYALSMVAGREPREPVVTRILDRLRDPREGVRAAAVEAANATCWSDFDGQLRSMVVADPSPRIRSGASLALERRSVPPTHAERE